MAISNLTAKVITKHPDGTITLEDVVTDPQHPEKEAALLNNLLGMPASTALAVVSSKPYSECVDAYMAQRPSIREKSKDELRSIFSQYDKWCVAGGHNHWTKASATSYISTVLIPGLHVTTVNKHVRRLSSLFAWCVHREWAAKNVFDKMALPKLKRRASDEKPALTHGEVEKLLAALNPGTDERHWLPILALYTGARANELAALYLKDIQTIDGVACLHFIEDSPDKKLKTANAERRVPLHDEVLKRGFMEYVQTMKEKSHERLFPYWSCHPKNGVQHYSGRWYAKWRKTVGIEKDFHALRHTVETALRDARVPESEAAELCGHAKGDSQSYSRYAKPGHLANLRDTINKLPINPGRTA